MASEISQMNGVEPAVADATEKMSSPVKQINAVILDAEKQTTPTENGITLDHSAQKNNNSQSVNGSAKHTNGDAGSAEPSCQSGPAAAAEPKAVVVEPSTVSAEPEPMQVDKVTHPAAELQPSKPKEEKPASTDAADSKPIDAEAGKEKVEVEPAKAEEAASADKPVEEASVEPTESSDVVAQLPKKGGRKPAGRKGASPKKTAATTAEDEPKIQTAEKVEKVADGDEPTTETGAASTETATTAATPKQRTGRQKRSVAVENTTDEEKTPLLEAPLVVEGKRSRQKVDRLSSASLTSGNDKKEIDLTSGKGTKLGDIPFIESMISKTQPADLKLLHRIAFSTMGKAHDIKKHLRLFNGFPFDADSKEYEKKLKSIDNATTDDLKITCGILGLGKSGKKDELIDSIFQFIVFPIDNGKKLESKRTSSPKKGTAKRKSATTGKKGKKATAAASSADEEDEVSDEPDEEPEQEAEPEAEKKEDLEAAEPPAKRGRRSKAAETPAVPKRGASTSSPRSAKKAGFPSDADLKSTIKELLKGVNLEEVTMKEMTAKVYAKHPNIDLTTKKDYIKDTVKALLSSAE